MSTKKRNGKKIAVTIAVGLAVALAVEWVYIGWRYSFGPAKALGEIRLKSMPGNAAEYDFEKITPMENSVLAGKTVVFLGSSVTNGAAALYQSIPEYFSARTGCTAVKQAVDGTTLCNTGKNSYLQRLKNNVDASEKVDLLVCQLSTNDATKEMPLGNFGDDDSTVTGAMESIVSYARETWNCPVVFYTNARFDNDRYAAMVTRLYELAEKENVGVLDLWSSEDFNAISDEQRALYMKDTIHPYKAGYRDWWGPELEKQLCAYLEQK